MTRLGITTRARAAASSITLMIIGSAFVLVGVLTLSTSRS